MKIYYGPTETPNMCISNISRDMVPARIKKFDGKEIQAWKNAYIKMGRGKWRMSQKCVVELLIPARAIRFQPRNKKCRASSAYVVAIYELGGKRENRKLGRKTKRRIAYSRHDTAFKYVVGKKVKPTLPFNRDHREECSTGIHFFLTAKEAANY
jgi:hypothetical protein